MSKHSNYSSWQFLCPFYKGDNAKMVYCEGIGKDSTIHLAFAGTSKEYKDDYCKKDWIKCPIATMLWDLNDK